MPFLSPAFEIFANPLIPLRPGGGGKAVIRRQLTAGHPSVENTQSEELALDESPAKRFFSRRDLRPYRKLTVHSVMSTLSAAT